MIRCFVSSLLLLALVATPAAMAQEEKPLVPDQELIRSSWRVVEAKDEGHPKPRALGQLYLFDTAKLHCITPEGRRTVYLYELDPTTQPKRMILQTDDELISTTAIYKLDGNKLTICLSYKPNEIPADFVTKLKDGRTLLVLKRETDR